MNIRGIFFFIGIYSLLVGIFSILNILYSIHLNFYLDIDSYIITTLTSFFLGVLFCYQGKLHTKDISLFDQILLIFISYFFLPLLILIPYFLSVDNFSFINSYFEAISGFTTTGFSIINEVQSINEPLLLWRSSSQWLGGLFFLISTIGTLGSKRLKLKPNYLISDSSLGGNFYNNFNSNFIKIFTIYFITTTLLIFLYVIADLRILESFNLSFTVISSGGFLTKNSLNSIVTENFQVLILSFTMLIPLLNFYLFFKIFTREFKFKDHQEDIQIISLILIFICIFYFSNISNESISHVFLAVISSISTSGISTYSSSFDASLLFILLTIIGGSLLSTSSGLKYVRFYIMLKISYQEIYKLVKPINVFNRNLFRSQTLIGEEDAKISFFVFISFLLGIFILTSILTLDNISFENSFKLSILTLTNTTASSLFGLNNLIFFDMTNFTKLFLMIFMIFGRIELITILFLIKKIIFKE